MLEYIENGLTLGWLIDPIERKIYVYSPGKEIEIFDNPVEISGETFLKGLTLTLKDIWG